MLVSAEHLQHSPCMLLVGRFAEDLPIAFGHGIAGEDQSCGDFPHDVGGLLPGQSGDELLRRFPAANPAFGRFVRYDDFEVIARFGQQFSPARRAAGKDKFGTFPVVHQRMEGRMRDKRYWRLSVSAYTLGTDHTL